MWHFAGVPLEDACSIPDIQGTSVRSACVHAGQSVTGQCLSTEYESEVTASCYSDQTWNVTGSCEKSELFINKISLSQIINYDITSWSTC